MKQIFLKLAILLLGLSTGAMLLIGIGIAPYWASLEPNAFMKLFADSSAYMGKLMIPLGMSTAAVTILATVLAYKQGCVKMAWLILASVAAILSALSFPLYFKDANALLQSMTLSSVEATSALVTWQFWHWTRIICSAIALIAAIQFLSVVQNTEK